MLVNRPENRDFEQVIVVVGGGIAATACVQSLYQSFETSSHAYLRDQTKIVLVSCKTSVKLTDKLKIVGRRMERFSVIENDVQQLIKSAPAGLRVEFVYAILEQVDTYKAVLNLHDITNKINFSLKYTKLCICTGAKPKDLPFACDNHILEKYIVKIRDSDSMRNLSSKLANVQKLAIIGNGGIGLEAVYKIQNCHKTWIIKDKSIGATFFDAGAAKFLIDSYISGKKNVAKESTENLQTAATVAPESPQPQSHFGCSLGPNWCTNVYLEGKKVQQSDDNLLNVIYNDEVVSISLNKSMTTVSHPIRSTTRNNVTINCDLVILALGVEANTGFIDASQIELNAEDKSLVVDTFMRTNVSNVYGAGDVVCCRNWPKNNLWFQIRLWTQARQMGFYAAKCIVANMHKVDPSIYFNFDCFTHVTEFFDKKVVLLGKFKTDDDEAADCKSFELLVRINPPDDYVKLVIDQISGHIIGAVLIGDSNLEETIENLMHDQIDVRKFKDQLLDNTVDIEDYFD